MHTDDTNELLRQIIAKLSGLPAQLRQSTADQLWSAIPSYVLESGFSDEQAANAPLQVPAVTGGLELITSIIVSVPAAAVLQLGTQIKIYVPGGLSVLAPLSIPLANTDLRSVTCGTAGPVSLQLSGVQQPTYGVLR